MRTKWEETSGTVFNIQRLCVNDGPGIRSTVFLKGCPLDCLWCHNPESKQAGPQLLLAPRLCVGCGDCARLCPQGCHRFGEDGTHHIDRSQCTLCGACVQACVGALELCGKTAAAGEVMEEVLRDRTFYEKSGGGLTVSGGDPTAQPAFLKALLSIAKQEGLHTCIETAGLCSAALMEDLAGLVDLFLYDIKETDAALHTKYTGVSNRKILENLRWLDSTGAKTILRCPIIPGHNDRPEHLQAIAALANSLAHIQGIEVMPYHPLGESKSESIGETYALKGLPFPSDAQVNEWIALIQESSKVPVKRG